MNSVGWPKKVPLYLLLTIGAVLMILPLVWMVSTSLKPEFEVFAYPPAIVPSDIRFENYAEIFTLAPFALQYWNSIYIGAFNVLGTLIISSLAGYAFARMQFPGRNLLFLVFLSALLLPAEVTIVPLYRIMSSLGWIGTHLPLLLEPVFGSPSVVGTFIMRQYFLSIPKELEEAARIDGAGRFGVFWRIALPMSKPAIATLTVITFLASWNSFLEPLVYTGGNISLWTVPVALDQYTNPVGTPIFNLQMAATTLSVIPVAFVFAFAQQYIVAGMANSGLKG